MRLTDCLCLCNLFCVVVHVFAILLDDSIRENMHLKLFKVKKLSYLKLKETLDCKLIFPNIFVKMTEEKQPSLKKIKTNLEPNLNS